MAVRNLPEGCREQVGATDSVQKSGNNTFSVAIKGPLASLKTWRNTFVFGVDTYDSKLINAADIRTIAGGLGVMTLSLGAADSTQGQNQVAYKGVWSFHSARNDASILAFCQSAAERIHVELWQKETDGALASDFKYKDAQGIKRTLSKNERKIAEKLSAGIETVVRFHPILTYTSYYHQCPKKWGVDLGLIRTPAAAAADRVVAPDNINAVIEGFEWLKMQDDVDELPDDNYKRVQSWWGIRASEGGWDANLYGTNRWEIASRASQQSQS